MKPWVNARFVTDTRCARILVKAGKWNPARHNISPQSNSNGNSLMDGARNSAVSRLIRKHSSVSNYCHVGNYYDGSSPIIVYVSWANKQTEADGNIYFRKVHFKLTETGKQQIFSQNFSSVTVSILIARELFLPRGINHVTSTWAMSNQWKQNPENAASLYSCISWVKVQAPAQCTWQISNPFNIT